MSSRIPDICIKCQNRLNDEEKDIGIPICQKCIDSLMGGVSKKIFDDILKKSGKDINNFQNYILSSGRLFGLSDVSIIQSSFNLFMGGVAGLEDEKIDVAEKILEESIKFINDELEKIRVKKEMSENPTDPFAKMMDDLMKKRKEKSNGDNDNIDNESEKG